MLTLTVLCCAVMLWVDGVWQPGYAAKSAVKLIVFLALPLLAARTMPDLAVKALFRPQRQALGRALLLGGAIYGLIVGGFFVLRPFVDFSGIAADLSQSAGVTRANFLWVSLYISFVNSLLEEFFFRGFVYYGLSPNLGQGRALVCSSLAFSLYHTAMMLGWFPLWLFLLALAGLAVGGALFILLNRRTGNLYTSWLVHMCANFAINTVGFILL